MNSSLTGPAQQNEPMKHVMIQEDRRPSRLAPIRVDRNIVFAHHQTGDLLMDLYRPPTSGVPVPVVLWLHGGGWFTGDRTLAPDLAMHVRSTGFAMVSIEYRLSGQALFPAQLHDVRAAIRYLRTHGGELGIDAHAIGLWGASAGGHLAALAGLTGHVAVLPGEDPSPVAASVSAVAASYAPVDLGGVVGAAQENRPGMDPAGTPEARLLGGPPSERPELARAANPLTWVTGQAPPFQLSHGTGDVLVPHAQSERLHAALAGAGVDSELYLLDTYRHGFLNPAGRLEVEIAKVMDDGRLGSEGRALASYRSTAAPEAPPEQTAFGFDTIDAFFISRLGSNKTPGERP